MAEMKRTISIGRSNDVPEGRAKIFLVEDLRVAVCRVQSKLYAVEDLCTHDDGPLGEGSLFGHEIECPRHGARFDVRDGSVLRMPAAYPVRTFAVTERDGDIQLEIDA